MSHPLNIQPDPIIRYLTWLAYANGYDYTTALMCAVETVKVLPEGSATELMDNMADRCAATLGIERRSLVPE